MIDQTVTPMGSRLLADWLANPLTDIDRDRRPARRGRRAGRRTRALRETLREQLRGVYDLERLLARVATGRASPRDLSFVGRTLAALPKLKAQADGPQERACSASSKPSSTSAPKSAPSSNRPWSTTARSAAEDGGIIRGGYSGDLDRLRDLAAGGKEWIARYQAEQVAAHRHRQPQGRLQQGLRLLHRDHQHATRTKRPPHYIRKQTTVNAERYITPELKEYEEKVAHGRRAGQGAGVRAVRRAPRRGAGAGPPAASHGRACWPSSTCWRAWPSWPASAATVRPTIVAEPVLADRRRPPSGARHHRAAGHVRPQRRALRRRRRHRCCSSPARTWRARAPTSARSPCSRCWPRWARFVPARDGDDRHRRPHLRPRRRQRRAVARPEHVHGRDDRDGPHPQHRHAAEPGRSSTRSAAAPAPTTASRWPGRSSSTCTTHVGCRTLFATHYHELTDLAQTLPGVRNLNVAVKEWEDHVVFLHKIVPGAADKSYGIHVARLAGVPRSVNERAKQILAQLEAEHLGDERPPQDRRQRQTVPPRRPAAHALRPARASRRRSAPPARPQQPHAPRRPPPPLRAASGHRLAAGSQAAIEFGGGQLKCPGFSRRARRQVRSRTKENSRSKGILSFIPLRGPRAACQRALLQR